MTEALSGLIASVLTETFKFFPVLRQEKLTTTVVALAVTAVVTFFMNGRAWSLDNFVASVLFSFTSYKTIIQPIADSFGLSTQK